MKFDELCKIEPALLRILNHAELSKRKGATRRQEAYEAAKESAWPLVGWGAKNPDLRNEEAWEGFVKKVSHVLRL